MYFVTSENTMGAVVLAMADTSADCRKLADRERRADMRLAHLICEREGLANVRFYSQAPVANGDARLAMAVAAELAQLAEERLSANVRQAEEAGAWEKAHATQADTIRGLQHRLAEQRDRAETAERNGAEYRKQRDKEGMRAVDAERLAQTRLEEATAVRVAAMGEREEADKMAERLEGRLSLACDLAQLVGRLPYRTIMAEGDLYRPIFKAWDAFTLAQIG
jgi:hypothetical protein